LSVRHLLAIIALASLLCMAVRSLLVMSPIGILLWPVLLGFGTERLIGGHGVLGGSIGGVLGFVAATCLAAWPGSGAVGWCGPGFLSFPFVALAAGACWGFYLSVWVYLLVETALQYR
jgi:hypothetical protein